MTVIEAAAVRDRRQPGWAEMQLAAADDGERTLAAGMRLAPKPRLLLAPITITPTKPLTATHVKGLLWLDVLYKATLPFSDVTYLWNSRTPNLSAQTLGFWDYLDRSLGDVDYSRRTAAELGELYVRYHAEHERLDARILRPYLERVETEGWVHPASRRLLELWSHQLAVLGVYDPGLREDPGPLLAAEEVIELLKGRGLCLDHRRLGGPVYLDGTRWGLPLRQIVTPDGHMNYLLTLLRGVIPATIAHDRQLLVVDRELQPDYVLVERVLSALGARPSRLVLGRVPIGGSISSARHGGWRGSTLDDLARLCLSEFDRSAYRLGMRIYFIAVLNRASPEPFRLDLLRRSLRRAERILASDGDSRGEGWHRLAHGLLTDYGHVDPYRLTVSLLDGRRGPPAAGLLSEVYV